MLSFPLPTGAALITAVKAFGEERTEEGKGKKVSDLAEFMPQAPVVLQFSPQNWRKEVC